MSNYKTLAFIDLETTGLPHLEKYQTKITELSVIACSLEHIANIGAGHPAPRVRHELTLCVHPCRQISPQAANISGLDNDALQHEHRLDGETVQLLLHFLNHLQQPVCLIAHNGNRFDFPLLHKELSGFHDLIPPTWGFVDSIPIFRHIDRPVTGKRFSLHDVHVRLFGCPPQESHNARADADTLFRCVFASRFAFLPQIDAAAQHFNELSTFPI